MKFTDLTFEPGAEYVGGTQAKHFFLNGYGISVIRSSMSYGGNTGLYEIAVLKGTEKNWHIDYCTDITGDAVIGHLTANDVEKYLHKIQRLERES